jgi:hypothetical protein
MVTTNGTLFVKYRLRKNSKTVSSIFIHFPETPFTIKQQVSVEVIDTTLKDRTISQDDEFRNTSHSSIS